MIVAGVSVESTPYAQIEVVHEVNRAKRYTITAWHSNLTAGLLLVRVTQPDDVPIECKIKNGSMYSYQKVTESVFDIIFGECGKHKTKHTLASLFSPHYIGGNFYNLHYKDLGILEQEVVRYG